MSLTTLKSIPTKFKIDGQHLFLTFPQNETDKDIAFNRLKDYFKDNLDNAIIAQELHKDGTPHLHIYFKLFKRMTTTKNTYFNFIADKQGNYQTCKKPIDVINYVIKSGDYITFNINPNDYIQEKSKGKAITSKGTFKKITDQITVNTEYSEILLKYPDICLQHGKKIKEYIQDFKMANKPKYRNWEMSVEYHFGDTGTGKSRYAFQDYDPQTHYILRKSNGENNVWWDGYTGQETVIIDDFSPKCYRLSYMLNLLDRYAMTIDIKGGSTQLLAKRIIITSNYKPDELYNNERNLEHKNALLRRITKRIEYKKGKEPKIINDEDILEGENPINNNNAVNLDIEDISEDNIEIEEDIIDNIRIVEDNIVKSVKIFDTLEYKEALNKYKSRKHPFNEAYYNHLNNKTISITDKLENNLGRCDEIHS